MNQGFISLYESYLDDERKLKLYQKRKMTRPVPISRVEIDESDFNRTVTVSFDGRVFYLDHVMLGVIRSGRFVCDRWAFTVFSMADVRKVRQYLESTWCFKAENLEQMVKINGYSLYHGAALVADRAVCVNEWVVSKRTACIYSRRQVASIMGAVG